MAYVYRHIRLDTNQPFYIGISKKKDNYKRAYNKEDRNNLWKKISEKTEYKVQIIFEDDDIECIKQKEIEFIFLYGRINLGTGTLANLTDGGDGTTNYIYTQEQIEANRQRNLEWNKDPKRREFIKNINIGRKATEEHKEKNRIAQTGRECKESTRKLLSEIKKGKKFDQEFKDKVSANKNIFLYTIQDSNDNIYKNIRFLKDFCKDKGLTASDLQMTFKGLNSQGLSCKQHMGFKIVDRVILGEFKDSIMYKNTINTENKRFEKYLNRTIKQYKILNINTTEELIVNNLTEFCKDNSLDMGSLIKTEKGFNNRGKLYNSVKGFKIISKTLINIKDV